jgi:hypothetical protein
MSKTVKEVFIQQIELIGGDRHCYIIHTSGGF